MESYNHSEHLKALHNKKKEQTKFKVEEALKELLAKKEEITYTSVALESGISRSTLYRNEELKDMIETVRTSAMLSKYLHLNYQMKQLKRELNVE